jgi:simple sugar transport system permease protein
MKWFFKSTRWGLFIRAVGDSPDAALAMGVSIKKVRMLCIIAGSFLAGDWWGFSIPLLPRYLE